MQSNKQQAMNSLLEIAARQKIKLFSFVLALVLHSVGLQVQEGSLSSSQVLIPFFKMKIFSPFLQLYNQPLKMENDCRYKEAIDCCKAIKRAG